MSHKTSSIRVREDRPDDLEWVKERITASSVFSVPYGRDIPNSVVAEAASRDFDRLMQDRENTIILIAENESQDRMGVLVLNLSHVSPLTRERQSLIEDLDVDPKFWGTAAVGHLVRRAAQVTAEHGLNRMVGRVSAGNRRTLVKSLRLGFEVESYHLSIGCDQNGSRRMPGRPDSEKAHLLSRKRRAGQRR